jgi:negative regulator of flagellin synthesis FlgM
MIGTVSGSKEVCPLADETDVKESRMKVTDKGPVETELSRLIQKDKAVDRARRDKGSEVGQSEGSTKIKISQEARELQRIAELARKGDELRAEKVKQLKEAIAKGEYEIDVREVAKSIVRSAVSRHLENK